MESYLLSVQLASAKFLLWSGCPDIKMEIPRLRAPNLEAQRAFPNSPQILFLTIALSITFIIGYLCKKSIATPHRQASVNAISRIWFTKGVVTTVCGESISNCSALLY